jgi:enoyl-CoA hydratase/carnithine racemase
MADVSIEDHGPVAVLRLTNGVINAVSAGLVRDLSLALREVPGRFKGMVLAGGQKFFSIGLDLPALLQLSRNDMAAFWSGFEDAVLALMTLPMPTVAAISGHAPAAGTILALACDFRLIASGKKLMGLNEIRIGLPVPLLADLMLRQVVGDRAATQIEYTGELLAPEKARALALVDGLFPEAEIEARAIAYVSEIVERPSFGFPLIKQHRTRDILKRFFAERESFKQAFLECWFSAPVQDLLRNTATKF